MTRPCTTWRREAFTVVELIVVMAILLILAGMAAVAVFGVGATSQQKATEALIENLQGKLAQHWSAARDTADDIPLPSQVRVMAGYDESRAKVIWAKLRMRRDFPTSYAEALNPAVGESGTFGLAAVLPPKPAYVAAVQQALAAAPMPSPEVQSSELLLLALQQSRRGGLAINVEESFSQDAIKDTNNNGLPEIVDSWGNPIVLVRWGYLHPDMAAVRPVGSSSNLDRDTEDPSHKLMSNKWNVPTNPGVTEFERLLHPIHAGGGSAWTPLSFYTEPTVVSFGEDGQGGINGTSMAVTNQAQEQDNIYGFMSR